MKNLSWSELLLKKEEFIGGQVLCREWDVPPTTFTRGEIADIIQEAQHRIFIILAWSGFQFKGENAWQLSDCERIGGSVSSLTTEDDGSLSFDISYLHGEYYLYPKGHVSNISKEDVLEPMA